MNETELLNHVRKTTEMGQYGIHQVLGKTTSPELGQVLRQSSAAYGELQKQADQLLLKTGGRAKSVPTAAKLASKMSAQMSAWREDANSRIAGMMIKGDTTGLVKGMRYLRSYGKKDDPAGELTRQLLTAEQENIERMKRFL